MTDSYNQNNVNQPRPAATFSADATLTLDSDMVVADSSANTVELFLPDARQIPSREIAVKGPDAGTNPVMITGQFGQTIDGGPSVTLTSNNESAIVKSDGNNWQVVGGATGGAAAPLAVEDEGGLVEAATTLMNFVGAGVTASSAGAGAVDVTIPGSSLTIEDEGVVVDAATTTIDFVGEDVTATSTGPGSVEVEVLGRRMMMSSNTSFEPGETLPDPLPFIFSSDFNFSGPALLPKPPGPAAVIPSHLGFAPRAGRLDKVSFVLINALGVGPIGPVSMDFGVLAAPYVGAIIPLPIPTVETVGPIILSSSTPVDYVFSALSSFPIHALMEITVTGLSSGPTSTSQIFMTAEFLF